MVNLFLSFSSSSSSVILLSELLFHKVLNGPRYNISCIASPHRQEEVRISNVVCISCYLQLELKTDGMGSLVPIYRIK